MNIEVIIDDDCFSEYEYQTKQLSLFTESEDEILDFYCAFQFCNREEVVNILEFITKYVNIHSQITLKEALDWIRGHKGLKFNVDEEFLLNSNISDIYYTAKKLGWFK